MVIESHSQVLESHDASRKNLGKEGSIAGNQKCELQERTPWAPKFEEKNARRNPKTGVVRPQGRLETGKRCL